MGTVASNGSRLIAYRQTEGTLLEHPLAVGVDKGKVACRQAKLYGLRLLRQQTDFIESPQAAALGGNTGHEVGTVKQHALFSGHRARIRNVYRHKQAVGWSEAAFIYTQLAVGIGGVALAIAKGPLHAYLRIVIVSPGS